MNEQRFQSLSHWGAFTAVVAGDRVVRCEPFARDPAPSPMLGAIPGDGAFGPAGGAARRARRLAQGPHAERPHEARPRSVRRGRLGRGAAAGRGRARARARGARAERPLRRLVRLGVGGTIPSRAHAVAAFPIRRRRVRRPAWELLLGRGAVPAAARHRHVCAGDRAGDRLGEHRRQHEASRRIRRTGAQERSSRPRAARASTRWRSGSARRRTRASSSWW